MLKIKNVELLYNQFHFENDHKLQILYYFLPEKDIQNQFEFQLFLNIKIYLKNNQNKNYYIYYSNKIDIIN